MSKWLSKKTSRVLRFLCILRGYFLEGLRAYIFCLMDCYAASERMSNAYHQ